MVGTMVILLATQLKVAATKAFVVASYNPMVLLPNTSAATNLSQLTFSLKVIEISSPGSQIPSAGCGTPTTSGGWRSSVPLIMVEIPGAKLTLAHWVMALIS